MTVVTEIINLTLSRLHPDEPVYFLFDPIVSIDEHSTLSRTALIEVFGENNITIIARPSLVHAPGKCPYLLRVADTGNEAKGEHMRSIFNIAVKFARFEYPTENRYICGWLQSPLAPQQLADNIAQHMLFAKGNTPREALLNPNNTDVFPIHTPLCQELIAYTSNPNHTQNPEDASTYSHWLGQIGISQWVIPTANRHFMQLKGVVTSDPLAPPVKLPSATITALHQLKPIRTLLDSWHQISTSPFADQLEQQGLRFPRGKYSLASNILYQAYTNLMRAKGHGLTQPRDQYLLASMLYTMYLEIDKVPLIKEKINLAASGKMLLSQALDTIPAHQMQVILEQLRSNEHAMLYKSYHSL